MNNLTLLFVLVGSIVMAFALYKGAVAILSTFYRGSHQPPAVPFNPNPPARESCPRIPADGMYRTEITTIRPYGQTHVSRESEWDNNFVEEETDFIPKKPKANETNKKKPKKK